MWVTSLLYLPLSESQTIANHYLPNLSLRDALYVGWTGDVRVLKAEETPVRLLIGSQERTLVLLLFCFDWWTHYCYCLASSSPASVQESSKNCCLNSFVSTE